MDKRNQTVIVCLGMVLIAALECAALSAGLNGTILTLAVAAIAGLAGYVLPQPKIIK